HLARGRIRPDDRNIDRFRHVPIQEFLFGSDVDIDRAAVAFENVFGLFRTDVVYTHNDIIDPQAVSSGARIPQPAFLSVSQPACPGTWPAPARTTGARSRRSRLFRLETAKAPQPRRRPEIP